MTRRTFDTVVHQEMANADNMSGGSGSGHCNDEDGNETITIKISIITVVVSKVAARAAACTVAETEEIEDRKSDEMPCGRIDGIQMISIDAPPPLANGSSRAAPVKGNVPTAIPKITVMVTIKNNNNVVNTTAIAMIVMGIYPCRYCTAVSVKEGIETRTEQLRKLGKN